VFGYCPRALCDKQKVLPIGLSDTLKTSRFKVFCPRCEEVYLPKFRNINIDGAYFGTSFPHAFLKHYPEAIILPPKIFYYEPKIFGFKVAGKRGSKLFQPPQSTIKFVEESMNFVDREKLVKDVTALNKIENKENGSAAKNPAQKSSPEKIPSAQKNAQPQRGR
jgi:casein kinase II subunit beta